MVAKEAVLIISLATEEFIRRITEASHNVAYREKRVTVQQKDIGVDQYF
jgi:DNA polymerase epsilon subunit 4